MRIAMIPLDGRPVNWQVPQRLAEIAGIDLLVPPRAMLGTLQSGAQGMQLAKWLVASATRAATPGLDAVVFSWDALIYGGLVQSRALDVEPLDPAALGSVLGQLDWSTTAGYAYVTLPRLGITVGSQDRLATHQLVREYFIEAGKAVDDPRAKERTQSIAEHLGERAVGRLWEWRERNVRIAESALRVSAQLGLRCCHVAVEDNAESGPHLDEAARLRALAAELHASGAATSFSLFDGADETASMLLAKAYAEMRELSPVDVHLMVHPPTPGADRYRGLYETHSLAEGLAFLSDKLGLKLHASEGTVRWLVVHGVQPQPDLLAADPASVFANPYLLPPEAEGRAPIFISDLCACNGANPNLVRHLVELAPSRIAGLVGFNTNFNSLATTAAWIRLGAGRGRSPAVRRLFVERLADDVVYQSLARPRLLRYLASQRLDPYDFSAANTYQLRECLGIVERSWRDWSTGPGSAVLSACAIPSTQAGEVRFSFPWMRAFEIEAHAPP
jgi:hypothetical protein